LPALGVQQQECPSGTNLLSPTVLAPTKANAQPLNSLLALFHPHLPLLQPVLLTFPPSLGLTAQSVLELVPLSALVALGALVPTFLSGTNLLSPTVLVLRLVNVETELK